MSQFSELVETYRDDLDRASKKFAQGFLKDSSPEMTEENIEALEGLARIRDGMEVSAKALSLLILAVGTKMISQRE